MSFSSIEQAIIEMRAGRFVIIADDEGRENEGDLVVAAEFADAAAINFCAVHARGLVCCALAPSIIDRLQLPQMVPPAQNQSGFGTPFTVSVEAREGVSTGISAADRARTVQVLIDENSSPDDLVMPGHMFPLKARANGVFDRTGQTEASVDLAKLSGLKPGAVICEIMNDDGTMARRDDLFAFSAKHNVPVITVEQLVQFRKSKEGAAIAAA